MIDDVELLRRYAQDSSEDAFAELVRRHIDLVYSAALPRVGRDTHLAEDITQKVFSDLAQRAGSLAIRSSLAGWLYTRARFLATDVVRAEQRRRQREAEAQLMNEASARQPTGADWDRLRPVLEQAVDELKPEDRNAVLLRFFERRPFAYIGALLCLSEDAAQKRVERSLEKLRGGLAKRGITSTTAALSLALANQSLVAAPAGLAASVTGAALASAAVSVPAMGLLQIMSTTKIISVAAVALALAALGTATYEIRSARAATAQLAGAKADHGALLALLDHAQEHARAAEEDAARWQQAEAARAAWDPVAEGKAFLTRHPDVRQALVARTNAMTNFTYGALYKSLTPDQIAQFKTIMLDHSGVGFTLNGGERVTMTAGDGLTMEEVHYRLLDLLGKDGLAQFQVLSQSQRARVLTAEAAGTLAFSESPLGPAQSDQLVQIMAGHQPRGQFDWPVIMTQARTILSPAQLAVVSGVQAEDAEQSQYSVSSPAAPIRARAN